MKAHGAVHTLEPVTTYRADPLALTRLAAMTRERAATVDSAAASVASLAASGPVDTAAALRTMAAFAGWAAEWAVSIDERARLLDEHAMAVSTPTVTSRHRLDSHLRGRDHAMHTPVPAMLHRWEQQVAAALITFDLLTAGGDEHGAAAFLGRIGRGLPREIAARRPDIVAGLGGAPLDARFEANRRRIAAVHANLTSRVRDAPADEARGIREELDMLAGFLAPERNFVMFDWDGAGRIAEWIGPGNAEHVTVVVPGMGSGKATVDSAARDAATMLAHAPGDGDLAVVTATVYESPDWLIDAASASSAEAGAPILVELLSGLALRGRHVTLVGHSYGSVVVGVALRGGLAAELGPDADVVLVGSPGVGVGRAADLGVDPARVWAGLLPRDEVRWALHPIAMVALAACSATVAPWKNLVTGGCDVTEWLVHGRNPVHAAFGANVFAASAEGLGVLDLHHRGYWATVPADQGQRPSTALANLLRIATGRYDDVTRDLTESLE